jgi:hypothetical protein
MVIIQSKAAFPSVLEVFIALIMETVRISETPVFFDLHGSIFLKALILNITRC